MITLNSYQILLRCVRKPNSRKCITVRFHRRSFAVDAKMKEIGWVARNERDWEDLSSPSVATDNAMEMGQTPDYSWELGDFIPLNRWDHFCLAFNVDRTGIYIWSSFKLPCCTARCAKGNCDIARSRLIVIETMCLCTYPEMTSVLIRVYKAIGSDLLRKKTGLFLIL